MSRIRPRLFTVRRTAVAVGIASLVFASLSSLQAPTVAADRAATADGRVPSTGATRQAKSATAGLPFTQPAATRPTPADDRECIPEPDTSIEVRAASDDADGDGGAQPLSRVPAHTAPYLAARERIASAMRASPDEFSRAVATWLDLQPSSAGSSRRMLQLTTMAAATTDARVYALAFRACQKDAAPDGCQALSARRWAVLEPGNAMPWLYLLHQANAADDRSGQDEALFHLAASSRIEDRYDSPAGPVFDAAGDSGANLAAANAMATEAIGMSAGQMVPFTDITRSCGVPAEKDANRRQLCGAVARLLADRSDTLLLRLIGTSLDAKITGDKTRLERLRAEPGNSLFDHLDAPTTCAQLRANARVFRRLAQIGELGMLREMATGATAR